VVHWRFTLVDLAFEYRMQVGFFPDDRHYGEFSLDWFQ